MGDAVFRSECVGLVTLIRSRKCIGRVSFYSHFFLLTLFEMEFGVVHVDEEVGISRADAAVACFVIWKLEAMQVEMKSKGIGEGE